MCQIWGGSPRPSQSTRTHTYTSYCFPYIHIQCVCVCVSLCVYVYIYIYVFIGYPFQVGLRHQKAKHHFGGTPPAILTHNQWGCLPPQKKGKQETKTKQERRGKQEGSSPLAQKQGKHRKRDSFSFWFPSPPPAKKRRVATSRARRLAAGAGHPNPGARAPVLLGQTSIKSGEGRSRGPGRQTVVAFLFLLVGGEVPFLLFFWGGCSIFWGEGWFPFWVSLKTTSKKGTLHSNEEINPFGCPAHKLFAVF